MRSLRHDWLACAQRRLCGVLVSTMLAGSSALANEPSIVPPSPEIEEMLVIGEQPGPGVWKISKGGNTLWILGVQQPLPKELIWRSQRVEDLIAQSQELIMSSGTSLDVDVGFVGFFSGLPKILRARNLPNEQTLSQVVEPDVYRKWLALKNKYVGANKRIERMRPVWAAQELQRLALRESGFARNDEISKAVRKIARKHRLEITSPVVEVELEIDDPAELFDRIGKLQIDDGGCFERTLDELDDRLDMRRSFANAWSVGDVESLVTQHQRPQPPECIGEAIRAMMTAASSAVTFGPHELMDWMRREAKRSREETTRRWLDAVDRALEQNRSTFALLGMADLVRPNGALKVLRDRGYVIEPPADVALER